MTQAVNRRPVTAKARVPSQVIPCEISGVPIGTGTGFLPSTSAFPHPNATHSTTDVTVPLFRVTCQDNVTFAGNDELQGEG
jgi:hypothetical protein